MTRWPLEDLADYVRGVAPADKRAAIETELAGARSLGAPAGSTAEGSQLREDLRLLEEIAAVLRGDRGATASDDALLAVSAMFIAAAKASASGLPELPILAVRDLQAGLSSGFRSAQLGHKELEIHGERFDLELSVDTPFDAIDVVVVGRLARGESEVWSVERVPAILVARGEVLATAVTNRFGEFHVAAESEEDDVELCLLILGVGQIRVPIDRSDPLFPERR
jgi:hypothetical protein